MEVTHHDKGIKKESGYMFMDLVFWSRVAQHSMRDVRTTFSLLWNLGGMLCAAILGVFLFLLDFSHLKQFVIYVIALPLSLFLAIKYLTLLPVITFFFFLFIKPVYTVTILSFVVPLSFIWVLLV